MNKVIQSTFFAGAILMAAAMLLAPSAAHAQKGARAPGKARAQASLHASPTQAGRPLSSSKKLRAGPRGTVLARQSGDGTSWAGGNEATERGVFTLGNGASVMILANTRLDSGTIDIVHDLAVGYEGARIEQRGQQVHPVAKVIKLAVSHYGTIRVKHGGRAPSQPTVRVPLLEGRRLTKSLLTYAAFAEGDALLLDVLSGPDLQRVQRDQVYKAMVLEGFEPARMTLVKHYGLAKLVGN